MPTRVHVPGCYKAVILNVCLLRDPLLMPLDLGKHATFGLNHVRIQRGGGGGGGGDRGSKPSPEKSQKYKNIGFLSNTDLNPLKMTKLPSQIQCRVIIGVPAKHHLNDAIGLR